MCCSKRTQERRLHWQQETFQPNHPRHCPTMAGIIAIGIGMGAQKLGHKIAEKRSERKEKKALEVRWLTICG